MGTEHTVDATFHAQVEPVYRWGSDKVTAAKVVRLTQGPPGRPQAGTVLVKLTLRLPATVFQPLTPAVIAVVPEAFVQPAIEVVVGDATEDQQ